MTPTKTKHTQECTKVFELFATGGEKEMLTNRMGICITVEGGEIDEGFESRKKVSNLIASAPELLEALIQISEIKDGASYAAQDMKKIALKAISKAESTL